MADLYSNAADSFDNEEKVPFKTKIVTLCILISELCERLAYYSAVENLVLYCTSKLEMDSIEATSIALVFKGTVLIVPVIFGGYIADSLAGKYNTIMGAGLIYILGLFLLPASSTDYSSFFGSDEENIDDIYDLNLFTRKVYCLLALIFIAMGTGGIKANVGPFGAEQVEQYGQEVVRSYFNWFYFFLNIGATIAFLGVAYIQQNISFTIGFLVPLASMVLAVIFFGSIRTRSIRKSPAGNVITDIAKLSIKSHCRCVSRKERLNESEKNLLNGLIRIAKISPIFVLHAIYFTAYVLSQSITTLQGLRMDVTVGDFKTPVAALGVINTVVVLFLIPLTDKIIYPILSRKGIKPTQFQLLGFGYILTIISLATGGIIEITRKNSIYEYGILTQNLGGKDFQASSLSVYWQIPQIALLASSEVFSNVTVMEFCFSHAPDFLKGLVMGIYLTCSGIGSYIAQGILKGIIAATGTEKPKAWFPDEINDGKAENIFFLLLGLMLLNIVLLIVFSKTVFVTKKMDDKPEKINEKINTQTEVADNEDNGLELTKYKRDSTV